MGVVRGKRWAFALVMSAMAVAATVVPVASFSSAAGAASTIKVGLLADNTGVYSSVFAGVTQGMEAELSQVNKAGGVKGHQISYTVYDTQSSPTQALAVSKQAVDQGNFALLVGSQFASYALPYLKSQNIPMVGWAVSPGWTGKSMFAFGGSTETASASGSPGDVVAVRRGQVVFDGPAIAVTDEDVVSWYALDGDDAAVRAQPG